MPEIGRIQSTNFQALLTELGIVRNDVPFALRSEVSPVVLVGGTVSFIAAPTPAYRVVDVFTAGPVAPALNDVLADTLGLSVGAYTLKILFNVDPPQASRISFQWRNAGNTANLWIQELSMTNKALIWDMRLDVLNANERFRVIASDAVPAGTWQVSIHART